MNFFEIRGSKVCSWSSEADSRPQFAVCRLFYGQKKRTICARVQWIKVPIGLGRDVFVGSRSFPEIGNRDTITTEWSRRLFHFSVHVEGISTVFAVS